MEEPRVAEIDAFEVPDKASGEIRTIRTFALRLRSTRVELCSLGASLLKFLIDENGEETDIVCGYKDARRMFESGNPFYFHAVVGRVANRIAGGKFSLNNQTYRIPINDPPNNSLHGGETGFSHKIWDAEIIKDGTSVRFSLTSLNGDEGFPGTVHVTATYELRPSISASGVVLQLRLECTLLSSNSDPASLSTPINLTNHSYFNLGDPDQGILDHSLRLDADAYTPVNHNLIPTRQVKAVDEDQTMDFRRPRTLRDAIHLFGINKMHLSPEKATCSMQQRQFPASTSPFGLDHNFVIRSQPGVSLPRIASLSFKKRNLSIYSDAPGVQVYSANYLGNKDEGNDCKKAYQRWDALCLETQHFPDSIVGERNSIKNEGASSFCAGKCPILSVSKPKYQQAILYRVETDCPNAWQAYCGSDTNDNVYESIEAMWQQQDLSSWYQRAKDWYEDNCDITIDGVLGGIGHISEQDLQGSRDFLKRLDWLNGIIPSGTDGLTVACECGAGIGRVSKGLLLDFFDRCDLVESSSRLLTAAPEHLGNLSSRCRFFCSELQDWIPAEDKYSVIWIQWVLCYLSDKDIVDFLRRCSESLLDGGWIILKENACAEEAFIVDVEDASVTRSLAYWLDLFATSGLRVRLVSWQKDFPNEIYPVPMIALQQY